MTPFFKTQLKLRLAPQLRTHGFKGSGLTFRRFADPVIQVVHVQGSRSGDSCCVELGTHLLFLPTAVEELVDPKRASVYDCEFRRRLAPGNAHDHWWSYGTTERDAALSAHHLVATLETDGLSLLDQYLVYPGRFALVTPESLRNRDLNGLPGRTTLARAALAMARIAVQRELPEQARDFIRIALEDLDRTPGAGLGVARQLREIERLLTDAG